LQICLNLPHFFECQPRHLADKLQICTFFKHLLSKNLCIFLGALALASFKADFLNAGDVWHFSTLLVGVKFSPELPRQGLRQLDDPVDKLEQIKDLTPIITPIVKLSNQLEFPIFPRLIVFAGFLGFEVSHDDDRERIIAGFQGTPPIGVVQKFDRREIELDFGAGGCEAMLGRSPFGIIVAEDGEARGGLLERTTNACRYPIAAARESHRPEEIGKMVELPALSIADRAT
jgi:hypothetical protein